MGFVLTDDELSKAIKFIELLRHQSALGFEGEEQAVIIRDILGLPSVQQHLLEVKNRDAGTYEGVLPLGEESVKVSTVDGRVITLGKEYFPLLEVGLSYGLAAPAGGVFQAIKSFFDWLVNLIEDYLNKKDSLYEQVSEILRNADSLYRGFRERVKDVKSAHPDDISVDMALIIPDVFVYLCRVMADPDIDSHAKIEIGIALVYLVSPIDIIPELFVPAPYGYIDDFGVFAYYLFRAFHGGYITREQFQKNWPGDPDFISKIQDFMANVKNVLGDNFDEVIRHFMSLASKPKPV